MDEYECLIVGSTDGAVVSKHQLLLLEVDGELLEVASPDLEADLRPGCVLITGKAEDVARIMFLLSSPSPR